MLYIMYMYFKTQLPHFKYEKPKCCIKNEITVKGGYHFVSCVVMGDIHHRGRSWRRQSLA